MNAFIHSFSIVALIIKLLWHPNPVQALFVTPKPLRLLLPFWNVECSLDHYPAMKVIYGAGTVQGMSSYLVGLSHALYNTLVVICFMQSPLLNLRSRGHQLHHAQGVGHVLVHHDQLDDLRVWGVLGSSPLPSS